MMQVDQSILDAIVRRVLAVSMPENIILFGSAATGEMTRDSDIDLLIVDTDPGDRRSESMTIRGTLSELRFPFDVIIISRDWYEASKNVIGGIAYPATKYGKVLYDAA